MSVYAGPRTPFEIIKNGLGAVGSFWNPGNIRTMWQDTAGTIPAVVNSEVKRVDDLGGLGNHLLASTGTRVQGSYTYVFKGPILRQDGNQYYLEFDGDGSALRVASLLGSWPQVTGNNSFGITLSVAFQTTSPQPTANSAGATFSTTGLSGTWLGNDALGNFGSSWFFGLRLSSEVMFYSTVRNPENTAWVEVFNEGDRYSTLIGSNELNRKVIYTAVGIINNTTLGGKDFISREPKANFSNVAFGNTMLLPQNFSSTLAVGARSPTNDNWIAGRFYGGAMIAKNIDENERSVIEQFLYVNCFR
jgi:hypothetical protein